MGLSRRVTYLLLQLSVVFYACTWCFSPLAGQDHKQKQSDKSVTAGFAFDPEKEEGPHPDSDFEWWYHFGFLKQPGATEFEYSFVSSFQRNKAGRYLFYNLANLKTGEHRRVAVLDRSLLGGWPIPPNGHRFLKPPDQAESGSHSPLSLRYDANEFCKEEAAYRAAYRNDGFALELKLQPQGPALPVCGTGLTGVEKPEDQHYYSYPRLAAEANLRRDGTVQTLEGIFWYDHQWGKTVAGSLMKWCWWGLQLDDGQNLNIIFLQNMRTSETVQTAITTQATDGQVKVSRVLRCSPTRFWTSPAKRTYAVEWEIRAPELGLTISTRPWRDDHELPVLLYGQIWEGPCSVEVRTEDGHVVKGRGFQEMIGQGNE